MTPQEPIVYVVDDDADIRTALQRSLTQRGYHVECFESAEEFLSEPLSERHGCLVLDVRMPGISGLQLQEKMVSLGILLPVIFITGHGDIPMSVRAIKQGAVDFLEKPYPVEKLAALIEQALKQSAELQAQQAEHNEIRSNFNRLTARECDVMALLVAGAATTSNKMIARELGISHRTVDDHRSKIMAKMRARSLPELVEMAKLCDVYKP